MRASTWWRWIALALLAVSVLAGCGSGGANDAASDEDRLTVVTSTSIIAALAREVGGSRVEVSALIGRGADPHTFDVSPGDVRTLAGADVVLLNGLGLDEFLLDVVESANGPATVTLVSDGIELREADDDHDHDHDHGDVDPHIWQDPLRVQQMVDNIAAALAEVDPDDAAVYEDNAAAYRETLEDTHRQIQALIDEIPPGNRKIVTNHEAFAYFADRYGLEVIGTVIPGTSSEAEPSASDIANLIALIETEGVRAIFAEDLIDPKVAESLAADTGVEIVHGLYTEQLGEDGSGAETVHGMLLANATTISEALR